jgi:hypothetical protein
MLTSSGSFENFVHPYSSRSILALFFSSFDFDLAQHGAGKHTCVAAMCRHLVLWKASIDPFLQRFELSRLHPELVQNSVDQAAVEECQYANGSAVVPLDHPIEDSISKESELKVTRTKAGSDLNSHLIVRKLGIHLLET